MKLALDWIPFMFLPPPKRLASAGRILRSWQTSLALLAGCLPEPSCKHTAKKNVVSVTIRGVHS